VSFSLLSGIARYPASREALPNPRFFQLSLGVVFLPGLADDGYKKSNTRANCLARRGQGVPNPLGVAQM
jgi:hypothetical protein